MNQKILTFYNKKTKEIIGYHHPSKYVVDNINDAYIYEKEIIDVDIFLSIFLIGDHNYKYNNGNSGILNDINNIKDTFFKKMKPNDIGYKYINYNMIKRIKNLKKIRLKLLKEKAVEWWNNLPIQNLYDMDDSWVGYVYKHFPNRDGIYALTDDEILFIWNKEKNNQNG